MQTARFIMADATAVLGADSVLDLAEYAHPAMRSAAWARLAVSPAPLAVILPADAEPHELELACGSGATAIVLNDVETAAEVRGAAAVLERCSSAAGLVLRLTTGRGLYAAAELVSQPRVAGLWYAADLLIEFDDEPSQPYYYDSGESRLAAPAWTRSLLLTIARAAAVSLWGQLDLSFAAAPPEAERRRTERLARLSGFDVVVARHPVYATQAGL